VCEIRGVTGWNASWGVIVTMALIFHRVILFSLRVMLKIWTCFLSVFAQRDDIWSICAHWFDFDHNHHANSDSHFIMLNLLKRMKPLAAALLVVIPWFFPIKDFAEKFQKFLNPNAATSLLQFVLKGWFFRPSVCPPTRGAPEGAHFETKLRKRVISSQPN